MSNLNLKVTRHMIEQAFQRFGDIEHIKIYKDANGNCRGFAYVTLKNRTSYEQALKAKFYFFDKLSEVEPYLASKKDLIEKDELLEKLRICVLNVPPFL